MDHVHSFDALSVWLQHYGSFALFGLLVLGIVALPIPDEVSLMVAGILMHEGHLSILPTIIAAITGSICGISLSYFLGRMLDKYFVKKYGSWIGLDPPKWQQIHNYFVHYGSWMLFFRYFIPGVRHFTGLLVGITRLEYLKFAPFAYSGALVWSTTFLSIGYFLGKRWIDFIEETQSSLIDITITVVAISLLYFLAKRFIYKP